MNHAFSLVRQRRVTAEELFKQHADPFQMLGKDVVCCCECRAPVMLRGSEGGLMRPHFAHYPVPGDKTHEAVPCDSRVTSGSESYIRREQKKHKAYGIGYLMRRFDLYQIMALNNAVAPGTPMFPRLETWDVKRPLSEAELSVSPMAQKIQNSRPDLVQPVDVRLRFKLTQPSAELSKSLVADELLLRQGLQLTEYVKQAAVGSSALTGDKTTDVCKLLKSYFSVDKANRLKEMQALAEKSGDFNDALNAKAAEISLDILLLATSKQNERLAVSALLSVFTFCLSYAVQRFRAEKEAAFEPWGHIENNEFVIGRDELFEFLADLSAKQAVFLMDHFDKDGKVKDGYKDRSLEEANHPSILGDWIAMMGDLWFAPLAYHGLFFINAACWLHVDKTAAGGLISVFEALSLVTAKGYDIDKMADGWSTGAAIVLAPYLLQEMPFDELFADMLADPEKTDRLCDVGPGNSGFIYLAHDGALDMIWGKATVKLGKSTDPERRGRQLAGQVLAKPLKIHKVWPVNDRHKAEKLVFDGLRRKRAAANRELFHGTVVDTGAKVDSILKRSGLLVEVPA